MCVFSGTDKSSWWDENTSMFWSEDWTFLRFHRQSPEDVERPRFHRTLRLRGAIWPRHQCQPWAVYFSGAKSVPSQKIKAFFSYNSILLVSTVYSAPCLFLAIIKERVGGGIPQPCNFPLKWPRLSKTHWMILAPPNPNFQKKRHPHPLIYLWGITTSLYNVIKKVTNISIYLSQVICSIENLVFSCTIFLWALKLLFCCCCNNCMHSLHI